jgi:type II secretory pathway component PulC
MKKRISAILPLLLITLVCVLAVEGLYTVVEKYLLTPATENKIITQVPEQKQVAAAATKRTAEEDVRIVLARNLFGPPPSAVKDELSADKSAADAKATSLSLVLMGTIVGTGEESRAIILEKNKKNQEIYQQGEVVQGAVLKEILRGKVVLTYKDKDEILDMTEAAKYSAKAPPPAAAQAQAQTQAQEQQQAQQQAQEQAQAQAQIPETAPEPVAATPEVRQEQTLEGMEPQPIQSVPPEPEPQIIETPQSAPAFPTPDLQPQIMQPEQRNYMPTPQHSSQ